MRQSEIPRSPWTEAAEPAPPAEPFAGETRADVAVVGAGFTGLAAALALAERGVAVTVLEAVEPGFGGSGRNGGQVVPGLKHDPGEIVETFGPERGEAIAAFVGGAADLVFRLIGKHGIACDPRRAGWLQGVHGPAALRTVERRAEQWAARGADVEVIDAAEVERRSGAQGYIAGFFDRRGGAVNPLAYARGLARAATAAGARIHGGSPATALTRQDGCWRIATPGGTLTAERVLLATNAYTDGLWPGLERSFVPVWSYQVATQPLGDNLKGTLVPGGLSISDTRRVLTYCRQDARGRLLVGGRGLFKESTDPADFGVVRKSLRRVFPQAAELPLDYCWGGRVALTVDHYPHIGELAPGLTAALGYNGRGVALASAVGTALAEHLAGAPLDSLPLPVRPFRPLPLHGLRGPVLAAAIGAMRLRDWWEARA